jgi:hypothetical protein
MPCSQAVFDGVQAYVEAGLNLLRGQEPEVIVDESRSKWVRDGDHFVRQAAPVTPVVSTFTHREALRALPEFEAGIARLQEDEVIAPQLGPQIGTAFGFSRIDGREVLESILARVAQGVEGLAMDPDVFERVYSEVEEWFHSDGVDYVLVAPILGLEAENLPIALGDGVEIVRPDDSEIARCLSTGVLRGFGDGSVVPVATLAALRKPFRLEKRTLDDAGGGAGAEQATEEAFRVFGELSESVDRVVTALRLLKAGVVGVEGYVYFSESWGQYAATYYQSVSTARSLRFAHYTLSDAETEPLVQVWTSLADDRVRSHNRLPLALRRFSYTSDRDQSDDRLIDLMIAAEALFLQDGKTELAYKLALRCAFFLGGGAAERATTFRHMKRAYNARSQVVHGDTLGALKLPDGSPATIDTFIDATAEYMRRALRKAIGVATEMEAGSLTDWDASILDAP